MLLIKRYNFFYGPRSRVVRAWAVFRLVTINIASFFRKTSFFPFSRHFFLPQLKLPKIGARDFLEFLDFCPSQSSSFPSHPQRSLKPKVSIPGSQIHFPL